MISTLTGNSSSLIKNSWSLNKPYCCGIDIICSKAFSISTGQIVYIGTDGSTYTVNIKVNNNEIIRYCNIVKLGDKIIPSHYVQEGDLVGIPDKYLTFEYVTRWKGTSLFPVHINKLTYYKQNPQDIIDGSYVIPPIVTLQYGADADTQKVEYTEEQKEEFTGGSW